MLSTLLYIVCLIQTHTAVVYHFTDYCSRIPNPQVKLRCVDDVPTIKQLFLHDGLQVNLSDFNDVKCGVSAVYSYTQFPNSLIGLP